MVTFGGQTEAADAYKPAWPEQPQRKKLATCCYEWKEMFLARFKSNEDMLCGRVSCVEHVWMTGHEMRFFPSSEKRKTEEVKKMHWIFFWSVSFRFHLDSTIHLAVSYGVLPTMWWWPTPRHQLAAKINGLDKLLSCLNLGIWCCLFIDNLWRLPMTISFFPTLLWLHCLFYGLSFFQCCCGWKQAIPGKSDISNMKMRKQKQQ